MAKRSKEMFVSYVCVYIRQFSHVRLAVKTLEVSNTISELDGQLSPSQKGHVFHEVV